MVALAIICISALIIAMSVAIALVLLRGYRHDPGHTGQLQLAVGLILLTTVPELLRIALPTLTRVGTIERSFFVTGCELLGLGVILWAIFGGET
ncbi:hypothetical protein C486_16865 [Natrinema gari JCM 14663]|uniref:Uncharacterized protein n=1 Tax=Natrinema gari JCM 14663 TaxID=1230459 RepID=L9YSE3_9EURY|nr:hypothetical protein C486_16865 [Natrinema gari JCM 14663]